MNKAAQDLEIGDIIVDNGAHLVILERRQWEGFVAFGVRRINEPIDPPGTQRQLALFDRDLVELAPDPRGGILVMEVRK